MIINFSTDIPVQSEAIICFVDDSKSLKGHLVDLDKGGQITRAINSSSAFLWKEGQILHVLAPTYLDAAHLFIVSIADCRSSVGIEKIGAKISDYLNQHKISSASILLDTVDLTPSLYASLFLGVKLKNYVFSKYYVSKKDEYVKSLVSVFGISKQANEILLQYSSLDAVADGVLKARDLVSEPANVLFPKSFADKCMELKDLGVNIKMLDEAEMIKLGMGALIGVAQGSANKPYTVIMDWNPEVPNKNTIAMAGKGVCFDTGGLNIKSAASNIADMKDDMGGAASVFGAMHAIAKQKLNVRVVGIIGLVENSVSAAAQRPSDVVMTMSGQTVEVENTDAEGRLVLSDIMWYVQKHYNPDYLFDIATLTGAVTVALGEGGYAGLFSNDDDLASDVLALGRQTGEEFWRLPLSENYDKQIDSEIADMRNTGTARGGGATIAAQFLQRFVESGRKWAHLDIANVAWNKKGTALAPKGATGFGVRILEAFAKKCAVDRVPLK